MVGRNYKDTEQPSRTQQRNEIDNAVEKFLKKGGIIEKVRRGMTATEYNIAEKIDEHGKVKKGYSIIDYSEKDKKIKRGAKPKAKRFGR